MNLAYPFRIHPVNANVLADRLGVFLWRLFGIIQKDHPIVAAVVFEVKWTGNTLVKSVL